MKRIFDIVFSIGAIIFFAPLSLLIGLVLKLTSKGPIFYSNYRVGKNNLPIKCWKFRTMHIDAEKKLEVMLEDPTIRKEWETYYKLKKDPRILKFGRFLRKTSLDELPQFINVIKGELSVVGPRPVTEIEVTKYFQDKAQKILSVRPGLTGIWQTSGRNHLTFDQRLELEESYIDKQSFFLDLIIILKTIRIMIFPKGAF